MLKFSLVKTPLLHKSDCLLLCLAAAGKGRKIPAPVKAADKALSGLIGDVRQRGDFSGKAGETLWLHVRARGFPFPRVLLAGLGVDDDGTRAGLDAAAIAIAAVDIKSVTADFSDLPPAMIEYAVTACGRAAYRYKCGGALPGGGASLRKVFISAKIPAARLAKAGAVAEGVQMARHLAEQPGNICTPDFLATAATAMASKTTLRVTAFRESRIKQLGMGGLLAVSAGSSKRPRFIILQHRGGKAADAPVVLVGKGVTFDTGGISLKPAGAMDEMKFDMCGAATVFGVMLACARVKMPLNVFGLIPACENMPGGDAIKPGDVITAMSGKTIEVLNTDAEGRLILADALTYAAKFKPAAVVDIATLTGACVVALGNHTSGLLGRGDKFLRAVQDAGDEAGDPCWRLPLGAKYRQQLKSDYADIANIGGRGAGTITAASFLAEFVDCENWAHLDIAGTAWTAKKRATGRPVPLLMRYLATRAGRA